jgi:hypothetical protein
MGDYVQVDEAAGLWCRRCGLPARVEGDPEYGRAVHDGTGEELGPPGRHRCAPIDLHVPSMQAARCAAIGFP